MYFCPNKGKRKRYMKILLKKATIIDPKGAFHLQEVDVFISHFDHDKKRLHYKLEMYEKSKNILSATTEVLSLYIDLNFRKVAEFEKEKLIIMDQFIKENKSKFKIDKLQFSNKLKK